MFKRTILSAACAMMLFGGAPALAANAAKEIATAADHAALAAHAASLTMVRAHLQHVINCLEGPKGADYDSKAFDPCKGQGSGAIPDSAPDKRPALEKIAQEAKKARAETDAAKAKAAATEIEAKLNQ